MLGVPDQSTRPSGRREPAGCLGSPVVKVKSSCRGSEGHHPSGPLASQIVAGAVFRLPRSFKDRETDWLA